MEYVPELPATRHIRRRRVPAPPRRLGDWRADRNLDDEDVRTVCGAPANDGDLAWYEGRSSRLRGIACAECVAGLEVPDPSLSRGVGSVERSEPSGGDTPAGCDDTRVALSATHP